MILTVTPNSVVERIIFVPRLLPNQTLRVQDRLVTPSGKGVDVSLVLTELGEPNAAIGFAAGESGKHYLRLLRERGIAHTFVQTDGDTRTNITVLGIEDHSHTTLADDTLIVHESHQQELLDLYATKLTQACCVCLGGTLPRTVAPAFYTTLVRLAHAQHVPVILDTSGEPLRQSLPAAPTWIKPNREELCALMGEPVRSPSHALQLAKKLHAQFGVNVLASLDVDGAIAFSSAGAWRIHPLTVPVVSPAGAGDALVAGLASALAHGQPIEHGLRLGTAAAAATVMQRGTAECKREDVLRLLSLVTLEQA